MQQRWHSREAFNAAIIIRLRSNAVIALVIDEDGWRADSVIPAKVGIHGWGRAATFALVFLLLLPVPLRAEKIRTVVPQSSLNYLSVYVAESKGYFQREGFDHETLVLAGPVAAAALVSGNVDFGGGGGSAMRAAASGAPLKAIFFQTDKVTSYLVTDPSIAKAADLKGKKVGVGGIGSSQDRMILNYVEQAGLAASDIIRINMGADASRRILAIKQG